MKPSLLLAVLLFSSDILACPICVRQPLKIAFQDSKMFFVGTVIAQRRWDVTFRVLEQFTGAAMAEVTLQTSTSCSMSSSEFSPGQTYLVEASDSGEGGLHAYLCSQTSSLSATSRELQLVRSRARWWKSRLGRISWYRFRHALGRAFGG